MKFAFLKVQIVHVESDLLSTLPGLWEHCVQGNVVLLFLICFVLLFFIIPFSFWILLILENMFSGSPLANLIFLYCKIKFYFEINTFLI